MTINAALDERRFATRGIEHGGGVAVGVVAIAIAMMPLLTPKGPGNTAPVDALMLAAIASVFVWTSSSRLRIHAPYLVPMAVLILSGAIAASFGAVPGVGALALVQEVFLVAWCAAIATVARTPGAMRRLLNVWAFSAITWAALLIVGVLTDQHWLSGVGERFGARARLTFDHPNLAASYFVVSLFVLMLARAPRARAARVAGLAIVGGALLLTGSIAAIIGAAIGGLAALFVWIARRADPVIAIAVVLLAVVGGVAAFQVWRSDDTQRAIRQSSNPVVRLSAARAPTSAAGRLQLFRDEMRLYRTGPIIGRGPNSTVHSLGAVSASLVKEAHSDYLATLVERGVVGVFGLILLIGSIGARMVAIGNDRISAAFRSAITSDVPLIGALVSIAASAITHETLHYRHQWALFGIVAAVYAWGRSAPQEGRQPLQFTEASAR